MNLIGCLIEPDDMGEYRFTDYLEREVRRKRTYLKKEWCIQVIENPFESRFRVITVFDFGE